MIARRLARVYLGSVRLLERVRAKSFSLASGPAFASFGRRSVVLRPLRLAGEESIAIGMDVFVGAGSWLQVLDTPHRPRDEPALVIGDGTSIAGACVLSAARRVRLGSNVLLARNVYIADHSHAFDDPLRPVLSQGITRVAPVEIGDGAWLGQNVVVGPGVTVGAGAVVGANSVVLEDVPPRAVAVGTPARIVRLIDAPDAAVAAR